MYCMNCGADMGNAQKCPVCGLKVEAAPTQPVTINVNNAPGYIHKKKWTTFWLCLLHHTRIVRTQHGNVIVLVMPHWFSLFSPFDGQ